MKKLLLLLSIIHSPTFFCQIRQSAVDSSSQIYMVPSGQSGATINLSIYPEAYVKLHIKNTTPHDQWDDIHLSTNCSFTFNYNFIGANVDTTFLYSEESCDYKYFGNFIYSPPYTVTKNGIAVQKNIPAFTTIAFDTITVNVNY